MRTPVTPSAGALRPLGTDEVRLTGGHWSERQAVNAAATIQHCLHWLEELGWIGNFDHASTGGRFERSGPQFSDSEVYKLAEAMAWEIGRTGDPALEAQFAELTRRIGAAQHEDGYLNTCYGSPGQRPRYADLEWGHELYCAGHLLQAAVARLRNHGEDDFTAIARRVADHVCDTFGPGGIERICGHAEIEAALAEFARATGEARYLEQARLFIERHGRKTLKENGLYYQDDVPVRDAEVLRGHAVRALYLAAGAVDVAVETGDTELLDAVRAQWDRTVARRTHLTGGMGSQYADEAFGRDFALGPDRAYSESCAGVAAVMTAWRLLLATGDARYGDMIERIAWNVLSGAVAPDGRSFFYANPLHQRTADPEPPREGALAHLSAGGRRGHWFEVSCCPTNLARTFAQFAVYTATADDRGVQIHQFTPCTVDTEIDGARFALTVETAYPEEGSVTVRVDANDGGRRREVALRVPAWAEDARLVHPDGSVTEIEPGTAAAGVTEAFAPGDEFRLEFSVAPRWTLPDPRVDAVRGCAAVEQGPLVLCAESIDLPGGDLDCLTVDTAAAPVVRDGRVWVAARVHDRADGWPYGPARPDDEGKDDGEPTELPLLPFRLRDTRGAAAMRVWLPAA
ncbi:glycoside hydrolase family 127 protein [Glycomyces terrestris]|uniref:Glycoside hydrolase family 127 protein n=1 Tax=Glycomyces terrestris TaxID=2493553 RepID=A0A426V3X2_9ACTN|nr:beta-L-arabinofuranosidase domain-containing protein [Glycomyces terrestris]RRS01614.1 glycoside hydrolase family 127 protein [Glycomyces terrestris]